ncbi:MAG: phage holin family protein [Actinobacteria bacterium]|nr:phage holin family protein [Actinomycetota bacterium]
MPDPRETPPLGQSVGEIIDRTTTLVHEEIELAKAEIAISLKNLLRGSVASILGGIFAFFGLIILLIGISFFLSDLLGDYIWLGFFIVALGLFVVGAIAAVFALRKIQKGSQIVPAMAISEARKTQEALRPEDDTRRIQQFESVAVEESTGAGTPDAGRAEGGAG